MLKCLHSLFIVHLSTSKYYFVLKEAWTFLLRILMSYESQMLINCGNILKGFKAQYAEKTLIKLKKKNQ